jgi:hypothetical protein
MLRRIIMWIVCKSGTAINTEDVARFRYDGNVVRADLMGLPVSSEIVGETTITEILQNIISGTKIMEVD